VLVLLAALVATLVLLQRGGTSTRSGTAACRLDGRLTPSEFGARGDGTTDDALALQRALNSAGSRHVPLTLGCRTYVVGRTLNIPSGVTLTGFGARSVLHFTWVDQRGANSRGPAFLQAQGSPNSPVAGVTLTNLTVDGPTTGRPTGLSKLHPNGQAPGVRFLNVRGFTIRNVEVRNVPSIGIDYLNSSNGVITQNFVHNTGRDGITGFYNNFAGPANIQVTANRISNVGDDAIAVNGAATASQAPVVSRPSDFVISNNTIHGWPADPNGLMLGRGIAIISAVRVTITNNLIDRTAGDGILIVYDDKTSDLGTNPAGHSSYITVTGNRIQDAGQDRGSNPAGSPNNVRAGLQVRGADHVLIRDNTITNSAGPPTAVDRSTCTDSCTIE